MEGKENSAVDGHVLEHDLVAFDEVAGLLMVPTSKSVGLKVMLIVESVMHLIIKVTTA